MNGHLKKIQCSREQVHCIIPLITVTLPNLNKPHATKKLNSPFRDNRWPIPDPNLDPLSCFRRTQ